MKALIIYDNITGTIYRIIYGDTETPQGIPWIQVDIPENAQVESIDVTDQENPKPVFNYLPESDIGRLQTKIMTLEEKMLSTQLALITQQKENRTLKEELNEIKNLINYQSEDVETEISN